MSVFNILTYIVNEQMYQCRKLNIINSGVIHSVVFCDKRIIAEHILPLCRGKDEMCQNVIERGEWYVAQITFGKNENNHREEIKQVIIENSEGDSVCCEVSDNILEELSILDRDELYWNMCDDISYNF